MKIIAVVLLLFLPILTQAQEKNVDEDFANQAKYEQGNEAIKTSKNYPHTVFMGNSITELWNDADPDFFKNNDFLSRGISGQVSSQMLLRFREDVIDLHPQRVVILAGTNDIAQNQGYISLDRIFGNIQSMTELAAAHDIEVVLCSVLPASQFPWRKELTPADDIVALNHMIKAYADEKNRTYIDYYSALKNTEKGMKSGFSEDGVHPNEAGYKVMEKIILNRL